jgi:hypothetical protein
MIRHWTGALLLALLIVAPDLALAQNVGLPPEIASAGITAQQWDEIRAEVRRQAQRAGVAEAALLAAAERAGVRLAQSGRFDARALRDAIIEQLETQARSIAELQERLAVLARAADPEIAALLLAARAAIDEGRLEGADALLAQAEESELAAIEVAEARAERARARIADAIAERGRLDATQGGRDIGGTQDAVARYERDLARIDRTLAPADWARTQLNLGIAYALLAQNGDDGARVLAVAALGQALAAFEAQANTDEAEMARKLIDALRI